MFGGSFGVNSNNSKIFLLEFSETGIVTKCSLSVSLLICCLFLVSYQKTDAFEGVSTDEGEGRWSLVPDQHHRQEPH